MKNVFEHIENAKGKPHHIKKRIVFVSAGIGTALVALVWVAGALSTGAFAIRGSNFADSTTQEPVVIVGGDTTGTVGSGLAGAAAALEKNQEAPAHIEIVDTSTSTPQSKQAEQTTIPF